MPTEPADQAVTTHTIREAAQRVVDAREANKRAFTQGGIAAKDKAMYEFEDAFADLRRVLALPDALTGSAPLTVPRVNLPPTTFVGALQAVMDEERAPGAVETPCLSAILDDQRHKDHCDRMHPADIYNPILGPCSCGVTARVNGAKAELSAIKAASVRLLKWNALLRDACKNVGTYYAETCITDDPEIMFDAAMDVYREELLAANAQIDALKAAAPPSAERILTQATDVEACADAIGRYVDGACSGPQVSREWLRNIIGSHFPARSGAAVVMPDEVGMFRALNTAYGQACINGGEFSPIWVYVRAALAHFKELNPAPSTASASESEEK